MTDRSTSSPWFFVPASTMNQPFAVENFEVVQATAPLPVIGVSGAWKISDSWQALGRLQLFRLEFDNFDGQLDHASLSLENNTLENVGFGMGYDFSVSM